ncbi:tetratricopeptide repeat protein [Oribacterium sp. C9]|uniref:tetratricopeptide repeat protein n=1 Tax=Oribacterium sp. C9 TaxID=1943579 RepID=UPI00111569EC|nr:tetratricopeptide repeat protein [Oribacterium sp. C9]
MTFKARELESVELPPLKTSQLGAFVRGDISLSEITNGTNLLGGHIDEDSEEYRISCKDIYSGIMHYDGKTVEDIYRWINTVMKLQKVVHFPSDMGGRIQDAVTENDILYCVYNEMDDLRWEMSDYDPSEVRGEIFEILKDILKPWVESGGREYSDYIKLKVAYEYDESDIDKQSEDTQKLFKECLDYCCDVLKDPRAIQSRGYCYYCGTNVYPNDWVKARDSFLEYYQMTGDASAANTLGYIYYYGRCNGGVPEYEQAFRYFSIGHAFSIYESTYKLGDMFAHGYGVVKDEDTANCLYWSVYKENLERFMKGDDCKFADAALRMGNVYRDGIGVQKDIETAYFYYLQADYAIRERIEYDCYGDTVVFNGIQKALEEARKEYTETGRTEEFKYPGWAKWTLIDHRRCRLTMKKFGDGALEINAMPLRRRDEDVAPKMLITIPKADYCELKDEVRINTANKSRYKIYKDGAEIKNEAFVKDSADIKNKADVMDNSEIENDTDMKNNSQIVFDSFEYDWSEGTTSFYLYDELVGEICTEYYTFTAPVKKKVEPSGDIYHFVSVLFEESGRCYDYLCDDKSVKVDDTVIVMGYDGEKIVKVEVVYDKYESELGLPVESYKKVIRKS